MNERINVEGKNKGEHILKDIITFPISDNLTNNIGFSHAIMF